MTSIYKVAYDFDIAPGSMVDIVPTPSGGVVMPIERTYSVSGAVNELGLYAVYHWDFIEDEDEYQALLVLFGLHNATTNEVTVYARNHLFVSGRYNGIAHRPEMGQDVKWQNFFPRDLDIYVVNMYEAA